MLDAMSKVVVASHFAKEYSVSKDESLHERPLEPSTDKKLIREAADAKDESLTES